MAVKCSNGHWYDPKMYKSCPHCKRAGEQLSISLDDVEEDDKTVSIAEVDISLGEQLGEIIGGNFESAGNLMQPEWAKCRRVRQRMAIKQYRLSERGFSDRAALFEIG